MKDKINFYISRVKSGRLKEMWKQTKWIYVYAKHYWPAIIFYTLLGFTGTVVGIITSWYSKDLVDIITGHQTGALVQTFAIMIGTSIGSSIVSMISDFVSSKINMKVNAEIKGDIFEKIMVTDWEALTD